MKAARARRGRSTKGRFWAVPYSIPQTYAWGRLSPIARAAWLEIGILFDGSNNGRIAVPVRWLAERLNVSRNTASKSISELLTLGFLEITQASSFSQKRLATEYPVRAYKVSQNRPAAVTQLSKHTAERLGLRAKRMLHRLTT
jgi:hypothetical protein